MAATKPPASRRIQVRKRDGVTTDSHCIRLIFSLEFAGR
jgi:hypothetical protein